MLSSPSILPYCGLTLVLSKPSRFDTTNLLSGHEVEKLVGKNLAPFSRFNCDIKLAQDSTPFLAGTKVVLLLGEWAKKLHPKSELSLNEARGYCYLKNGIVYISTYEPQDCCDRKKYEDTEDDEEQELSEAAQAKEDKKSKDHSPTRRKNFKFWFEQDLRKAIEICSSGFQPKLHLTKYENYLPSNTICALLHSYKQETLFFDIETNEDFNITCFSFSLSHLVVHTVPIIRRDKTHAYSPLEICKIFASLSLCFSRNTLVIHNALFDLFILAWRYRVLPPLDVRDTMLQQHRLSPETEKSLGHCISTHTHEEFHKNENIFNPHTYEQEQQLWRYNAKDVTSLCLVYHSQLREAATCNLLPSFARANSLIRPYLLMSLRGIRLDLEYKTQELGKNERLQRQYLRIIKILIGYDIEVLGWQRVAKYLYDYKSLPKPNTKYEKDGSISHDKLTASITLYKLLLKHDIPFLKVVLAYRGVGKDNGFLKFLPWNQTRFTCSYNIGGTDTYRLASYALFGQWGSNAQNVRKQQRRVCIADEGKVLIQTDQSGAEALVVAYLAPPGKYRRLLESGVKLYVYVAMYIFCDLWKAKGFKCVEDILNAPIEKAKDVVGFKELETYIKETDNAAPPFRYYYHIKQTCLSANYDIKWPTFQLNMLQKSGGQILLPSEDAKRYLGGYHSMFPEIKQWQGLVLESLGKNKMCLYNLFGDRKKFNGHWDDKTFKAAYAFVPQSTVGMLTNMAIAKGQQEIEDGLSKTWGWDILANGHDAILSQANKGMEKVVARKQEELLASFLFKTTYGEFRMKSESNAGENWYNLNKT